MVQVTAPRTTADRSQRVSRCCLSRSLRLGRSGSRSPWRSLKLSPSPSHSPSPSPGHSPSLTPSPSPGHSPSPRHSPRQSPSPRQSLTPSPKLTRKLTGIGLLVFLVHTGGCYSFSGSNLPGHIRSVAIPTVKNATLEPGVEQAITEGIVDRFLSDGRLRIASQRDAQAVFLAEIVNYENKVNNYSASQEPIDYIVVLTLSATMRDQVKNRDLWKDDRLVATGVYEPAAGETELGARDEAIETLANDVVGKTLEQW